MNIDDARKIAQAVPDIIFEIAVSRDGVGMATMAKIDLVESLAKELPVVWSPVSGREYLYIRAALTHKETL